MSDQDRFDEHLAGHFGQEHRHIPADAFVADTMRRVRAGRRRMELLRLGVRIAALVMLVAASPWLIAGAARINAALDAYLRGGAGLPVALGISLLVVVMMLATRLRGR